MRPQRFGSWLSMTLTPSRMFDRLMWLFALQSNDLVRTLAGYGSVPNPHCAPHPEPKVTKSGARVRRYPESPIGNFPPITGKDRAQLRSSRPSAFKDM